MQRLLGVTPTGYFGPLTQAAVKRVQQRAGLAPTGVIASLTWEQLDRLARERAA